MGCSGSFTDKMDPEITVPMACHINISLELRKCSQGHGYSGSGYQVVALLMLCPCFAKLSKTAAADRLTQVCQLRQEDQTQGQDCGDCLSPCNDFFNDLGK